MFDFILSSAQKYEVILLIYSISNNGWLSLSIGTRQMIYEFCLNIILIT